jgi:hypothetical protein
MSKEDFDRGKRDAEEGLSIEHPHEPWHGLLDKEEIQDNKDYDRGREAGKK